MQTVLGVFRVTGNAAAMENISISAAAYTVNGSKRLKGFFINRWKAVAAPAETAKNNRMLISLKDASVK